MRLSKKILARALKAQENLRSHSRAQQGGMVVEVIEGETVDQGDQKG